MDALLNTLLAANTLKVTPRTGWVLRGVPEAENVAAHSYGVAFTALVLAEAVQAERGPALDRGKLLSMALLHDLAESVIGDLPMPAQRFFPETAKHEAESAALRETVGSAPGGERLLALWDEYEARTSPEARLVRDADRLDMLLQATVYMERTGNRTLSEFFEGEAGRAPFEFAVCQSLYAALKDRYEHLLGR